MTEVVGAGGFDGVSERVAVVEDGPPPSLAFVGHHHVGLDLDAGGDSLVDREFIEAAPAEEVILRDLADTTLEFPVRERLEGLGVADHGRGLPERADEVLALGKVHTCLAADCGLDLAEKGGRPRNEPDASVVHRGDEPADIGHDTAPDGDDRVGPSEPGPCELAAHVLHDRERFGRFAIRKLDSDRGDARVDRPRNAGLRKDGDAFHAGGDKGAQFGAGAMAHEDGIAAVAEIDGDRGGHADQARAPRPARRRDTAPPSMPRRSGLAPTGPPLGATG